VLLRRLAEIVVPPRCLACAGPVGSGESLCRGCRAGMPWLPADCCTRCCLPLPCGPPCPARAAAFEQSWAPVAYDGPARALVHALKLGGMVAAADVMAAQIAACVPPALLAGGTLVPVPGHPRHRRRRGFDQAERIAAALGRRTKRPVSRCLVRGRDAPPQAGASRAERLRNGGSAIAVSGRIPPRAVLIDDVHTTGATLDACARALRAAGAGSVVAVTYARTR
jgi:predicted amidophosphoribosyltransferase